MTRSILLRQLREDALRYPLDRPEELLLRRHAEVYLRNTRSDAERRWLLRLAARALRDADSLRPWCEWPLADRLSERILRLTERYLPACYRYGLTLYLREPWRGVAFVQCGSHRWVSERTGLNLRRVRPVAWPPGDPPGELPEWMVQVVDRQAASLDSGGRPIHECHPDGGPDDG